MGASARNVSFLDIVATELMRVLQESHLGLLF